MANGGDFICLIKPQFEVGKEGLGKGGIVKDDNWLKILPSPQPFHLSCTDPSHSPHFPGALQSWPVGLWPVPFPLKGHSAQNSLHYPCKTKLSSSSALLKALTLVQTKRTLEVPHDLAHSLSPPHTDTVTYVHLHTGL